MVIYGYLVMYGYLWLCMVMYGYLWLCMVIYGYVRLCMVIYGYVWLCMVIYGYVIYIPWLRGVYQQYETRAPRYLPEAKPRADIKGRGSHIADTHREDMVHIIYSIAYCNINDRQNKTQTPPLLSLAYFCACAL